MMTDPVAMLNPYYFIRRCHRYPILIQFAYIPLLLGFTQKNEWNQDGKMQYYNLSSKIIRAEIFISLCFVFSVFTLLISDEQ